MSMFVRQFVSYCQYQVYTGDGGDGLEIYTVGDDLLHVGGPAECTGFTGLHTGEIDMRIVPSASEPPVLSIDDWDAASETTLWCPDGRMTVIGLMSGPRDGLDRVPLTGHGLMRVRAYARNRIHESVRTEEDPPEQHELHVWPVTEETGSRTLYDDGSRGGWPQRTEQAATWALTRLLTAPGTSAQRVTVVRRRDEAWTPPETIFAGDLEIRLRRVREGTYTWEWVTGQPIFPDPVTRLPDDEPSTVRLTVQDGTPTVRHEGVPGHQAVLLGLVWDHLLGLPPGRPPAWEQPMRATAAEATRAHEERRRRRVEQEAAAWGGVPPTERMRGLRARAKALAKLDRALLDRLAGLPADRQRKVACWAVRRAMASAALDRVPWIALSLEAVEAGGPLPDFLIDHGEAFRRLLEDPEVPQTLLEMPGGPRNVLHQAVAFPALLALGEEDPLAAAIEAVYIASSAHGSEFRAFLAEAHDA
ncbi:hypothetical protein AB0F72_26345 [Actinoplanes sp. NPDC023936]|uniref:hypothetical protein n=1 Tax=Actinoplanes sp. NPDC023936 TaxID=3154910 RepID=UPI0033D49B3F